MQKLLSVIYKSTATTDAFSSEEQALMDYVLLENRKLGITGFLVRTEINFYQCLEGKESTIRDLIERIRPNPLHTDFRILSQSTLRTRNFPRWYMEYHFLTEDEAKIRFENCGSDQDLAKTVFDLMSEKARKRSYLNFR